VWRRGRDRTPPSLSTRAHSGETMGRSFGGNSWNKNILVTALTVVGRRNRYRVADTEIDPRTTIQVTLGVSDIRLIHIKPEDRKRPSLFEKIEKAACLAADVEKFQFALVSSTEKFMALRQGLPACCIGCLVEEHLDLRVISTSRIVCHPAARLEMEILQIVARPLPGLSLRLDFIMRAALAASMDCGEIIKE
jgi:hypothetical protein